MRQGSNTRRPRSRGNGKRHPSSSKNTTVESSGPDGKVRGTAQQVHDKYLALARDALSSGDRVAAETFAQFADHYYRLIQGNRTEEERQSQSQPDNTAASVDDDHGGDEEQGQSLPRNPRGVPVAEIQEGQDAGDTDDDVEPKVSAEPGAESEVTAH